MSQTRRQRLLVKLLAPDTIGVLLICVYIMQFLIYPEAVDYINMTLSDNNSLSPGVYYSGWKGQINPCYSDIKCRYLLGVVEIGIGALKGVLLFALLFALINYLRRVTRKSFLKRLIIPLMAAFGFYMLHLGVIFAMLMAYPKGFGQLMPFAILLYHIGLMVAAIVTVALLITAGLKVHEWLVSRAR